MLNHVGNEDDLKMTEGGQHLARIANMNAIEVFPQSTAIAWESLNRFKTGRPVGALHAAVPNVEVFTHQCAVLAETTADFQHRFRRKSMQNRDNRRNVLRITRGHTIAILSSWKSAVAYCGSVF